MVKKKILILTASPVRDRVIDQQIADELIKMGNQVWVKPCLREGRKTILELRPDVVVVPPIRNPYSRDMAHVLKRWGCGVISRHTEASCDWTDFKRLVNAEKANLLGRWPYEVDVELVWGADEAQILTQMRKAPFPAIAVGSFAVDIYFKDDLKERFPKRPAFNTKYKLDPKKKNLLIASPWGFADSAPDLSINEMVKFGKEKTWQTRHLEMIKLLHALPKWNIIVTLHPGVVAAPYKKELDGLGIPIDITSTATELLVNMDALIHAGSTMAMEAHFLNIPAYQFGDVNMETPNWFANPDSPLSKISPYFKTQEDLLNVFKKYRRRSNANKETLKVLENGRYGKMDGQATKRAAQIINKVKGNFKHCWPESTSDYSIQAPANRLGENVIPIVTRNLGDMCRQVPCGVCGKLLFILNTSVEELCCPHCGVRTYKVGENFRSR